MTKIVQEVDGEGLISLLGKRVILLCTNYFYSGVLEGVNTSDVLLADAGIVYETGKLDADVFADFQKFGGDGKLYVRTESIESYRSI